MAVTIFYDGFCPLCQMEMRKLAKLDRAKRLIFEDIHQWDFCQRYPQLEWRHLNARIHALRDDGKMVTGLDATHLAWQQVGKGWIYAPLRWPVVRWFADGLYLFFAKHRMRISFLFTGKRQCRQCHIPVSEVALESKKGQCDGN